MLLEASGINRLDTPINAIDREFGGTQSHNGPKPLMSCLNSSIVLASKTLPEYPSRRDRG